MSSNPYDFINDFDKWLYWQTCVDFEGLTPKQATQDSAFVLNGWKRCHGKYSGGWSYPGYYERHRVAELVVRCLDE